jgi:anti-sigma B factor antagonist
MAGSETEDRASVAVAHGVALVRIVRRGSYWISPAVKRFGIAMIDRGIRRLVFDMKDCIGMDSTFMGVLAGLALRLEKTGGDGRVILINLTDKTRQLLKTLGIDRVVEPYMAGEAPEDLARAAETPGAFDTVASKREVRRETTETMIEAHEDLVKVDAENRERFRDVLAFLRDDLKQQNGDEAER